MSADPVEPDLRWTAALDAVGANRGDQLAPFRSLAERYAEPGRRYHTLAHASAVVDVVLSLHEDGDAWAPTVLAGWFHDAVYDPMAGRGVNEGASAVLATEVLGGLGASLTAVGEVARLVCLTASHDPDPHDRTGGLLTDGDLAVLGADEDRYDAYVADVRAEYDHVDDDAWQRGRAAFLRSFLARPAIFRTAAGQERFEAPARSNLSRELEGLGRA